MYSYFSDLHVQLLAQGLLQPGEQLIGQAVTETNPWWGLGLFRKTYLALATGDRLILIEHRMAWLHASLTLHAVESIPWQDVEDTRIKGIFRKKIQLSTRTQTGRKRIAMRVPNALFGLLAPMKNNMQGARKVVGAFQATRQLAGAQAPASLPPMPYGAPQVAPQSQVPFASVFAPPPPPPPYGPPHPAINAQGYASVPPPVPPPYGGAPPSYGAPLSVPQPPPTGGLSSKSGPLPPRSFREP